MTVEHQLLDRLINGHFYIDKSDKDKKIKSFLWSYKETYSIYDVDPGLDEALKEYFKGSKNEV